MLLITNVSHCDQPTLRHSGKFALHGSGSRGRKTYEFLGIKASIRLTEKQREHALLCRAEKCVAKARVPRPA
jgi:hypothetical protein